MRIRVTVNPAYKPLSDFIESIPTLDEKDLGEVIYSGRNTIYNCVHDGVELTIKSFKIPPLYNRFAYTYLRKSKAKRSYENSVLLLDKGINTAHPVGHVEVYEGGMIERSYYISRTLHCHDVRKWENMPDNDKLLHNLAKFMMELHEKGIYDKDFSPGNVLYDEDYNFYLIDVNRMKFGVHSKKKLMHNFRAINVNREETAHIARIYAEESKQPNPEEFVAKAMEEVEDFWREHERKEQLKKKLHKD
jgi:hypothetical protein